MCTVSFVPNPGGFDLLMNRDEQRTRVTACPPAHRRVSGTNVTVLGPSEPRGGMWIAANSKGLTLALLNWYAKTGPTLANAISRGDLVASLAGASNAQHIRPQIEAFDLAFVRPFRLLEVWAGSESLREWRWDGDHLDCVTHAWAPRIWASSGYDEPEAQRVRGELFERLDFSGERDPAAILVDFHRSHQPTKGASSVCMHREEAASVSCTAIHHLGGRVRMRYWSGPPCGDGDWTEDELTCPA